MLEVVKRGVRMAQESLKRKPNNATGQSSSDSGKIRILDSSGSQTTVPSAPVHADDDEQPCSSTQALQRDRGAYFPTPSHSVVISSISSPEGSKISLVSGVTDPAIKSADLNKSLGDVSFSPARPSDLKKPSILRKKLHKWRIAASEALQKATGIVASPHASKRRKCVYCSKLLAELSEKYKQQETMVDRYKALTSIPKRFSVAEVVESVGCTAYVAKKASKLKHHQGAFSFPPPKHGRPLSPDVVELIRQYYIHDDNSRPSPNLRDVVQVKMPNGDKVTMEKRRIFHSLNDLYNDFIASHPQIQVSLSKFCKLRPKNCFWPGLKGYHVTCVCEIHQNFEFLLEALDSQMDVHEFVTKVVCENKRADCFLGLCSECPKSDFINQFLNEKAVDECITYDQWVHTDSTDIQHVTMNAESFRTKFLEYIPKIVEHEFVTNKQKEFIRKLRDVTIKERAAITVQVDYAQNYSFIVQNAVQGYHWTNKQATIHPFVVHWWSSEEETIKYKTYCIISDELVHDADSFHVFQSVVIPLIKKDLEFLHFQKIFYVSDGAAGQYKNFKNFANLMMHPTDFGLAAEWHFTSTSHGKSTCDAISAVVKCSTRRQSLKRGQYITTPLQMFDFCSRQLTSPSLVFTYVTKDQINEQKPVLAERYKQFKTIQGTRKHHAFVPKNGEVISMGRTSDAEVFTEIDFKNLEICQHTLDNVQVGSFYAFHEGSNYQVGLLVEVDSEEGDAKFQVMKLNRRNRNATWPAHTQFTDVAFRDILMKIQDPSTEDGEKFLIEKDVMAVIRQQYSLYKAKRSESGV